jgi:hypothetical protein
MIVFYTIQDLNFALEFFVLYHVDARNLIQKFNLGIFIFIRRHVWKF